MLWVPAAEEELTAIWLTSTNRNQVTMSAYEIDERLRIDPENQGESRENERRILVVPPLGVKYEVKSPDRIVQVLAVWTFEENP